MARPPHLCQQPPTVGLFALSGVREIGEAQLTHGKDLLWAERTAISAQVG